MWVKLEVDPFLIEPSFEITALAVTLFATLWDHEAGDPAKSLLDYCFKPLTFGGVVNYITVDN